jgi:ribonuclease HI
MPDRITIYTDGSSLGNPGPGGWGAVIKEGADKVEISGSESYSTNNRMEMKAIIEAMNWIKYHRKEDAMITLYSDSSLIINSLNNNWKRKSNLDLWDEMDEAVTGLNIIFKWVKGHAGIEENEICNDLAIKEATKAKEVQPRKSKETKSKKQKDSLFKCLNCKKKIQGKLSFMPDSGLIRVDCDNCDRFIKFAEKSQKNLKIAQKNVLLSKNQLKKIVKIKKEKGENTSDKQIQLIKKWTKCQAEEFISSQQKLL